MFHQCYGKQVQPTAHCLGDEGLTAQICPEARPLPSEVALGEEVGCITKGGKSSQCNLPSSLSPAAMLHCSNWPPFKRQAPHNSSPLASCILIVQALIYSISGLGVV